ncbi:MAG TPA: tetraacyldisaccharide 4'-kinase [Desulfuromonadaceae bacterium]|jgi:tetraacyldisaccharide 4'-kinase
MKASHATYWRGLGNGTRNSLLDRLLLTLLIPLSLPYALVQHLRAWLYRIGIYSARKLPRPVISIGNLTVGGTGKTPVTAYIARQLLAQGMKVAVLSRGYGGSREGQTTLVSDGNTVFRSAEECGDEPFLLATTVPELMVVTGSNRHAAGLLAMEQLSPDIFLLDDGFQHLRLERDLNILLLDCTRPFGNGWTLPAGLLREPKSASARADLVIQTRCPQADTPTPALPGAFFCNARHNLADAIPLSGGEPLALNSFCGRNVVAFAGIAEPQTFFDGLRLHKLNVVASICFPDHVVYGKTQIIAIADMLRTSGADYAITTEKDGVKLKHFPEELAEKTLLARLELIIDNPAPLKALLRNLLQK